MTTNGKRPPRATAEPAVNNRLVCQALCQGPLEPKVTAVSGAAARTGQAHIAVRYGRLLLYLEDRAALEALSRAVGRAEELATTVFGPPEDAFEETRQVALRLFERTGKLPLRPV